MIANPFTQNVIFNLLHLRIIFNVLLCTGGAPR